MIRLKSACERLTKLAADRDDEDNETSEQELDAQENRQHELIVEIITGNIELLWQAYLSLKSVAAVIEMTSDDNENEEPEHSGADVFEAVCNLGEIPDLSGL